MLLLSVIYMKIKAIKRLNNKLGYYSILIFKRFKKHDSRDNNYIKVKNYHTLYNLLIFETLSNNSTLTYRELTAIK